MKSFVLAFVLVAAPLGAVDRPNVLFVLADDLGWGDLKSYGHPQIKTPHLDRLAQQGTRFTQFYVASPVCSPSRAAFLTGEFPGRESIHGHFGSIAENAERAMPQYLDPARPQIAAELKRAGYATAHIGKWHLRNNVAALLGREPADDRGQGPSPAAYGFDYVGSGEPFGGSGPKDDPFYRARSSGVFVDEAIAFIREHRTHPFYVQLWALLPHARLNPTVEQLKPYAAMRPGPAFPHASAAESDFSSVTNLDAELGRLFAALDDLDLAKNTLIVFTSDNGPEDIHVLNAGHSGVGSTGPFRGRKRSLYEGGVRVPFIVRWPGRVPAGRVDDVSIISAVDFRPTVLALAGLTPALGRVVDGENIADILFGALRPRTKPLFWEWRFPTIGHAVNRSPRLAVREGKWKLLCDSDLSRVELFLVGEDPTELTNHAREQPVVVNRLSDLVRDWSRTLPMEPVDKDAGGLPSSWSRIKFGETPR